MAIATVNKQGRIADRTPICAAVPFPRSRARLPATVDPLAVSPSATAARIEGRSRKAAEGLGRDRPVDASLDAPASARAGSSSTATQGGGGTRPGGRDRRRADTRSRARSRTSQSAAEDGDYRPAGPAIIAHDFNKPARAIMMATDFLLTRQPTDPSFQDIMQIRERQLPAAWCGRLGRLAQADHASACRLARTVGPDRAAAPLIGETDAHVRKCATSGRSMPTFGQFEAGHSHQSRGHARDAMALGGTPRWRTSNVGSDYSARLHHNGMPFAGIRVGRGRGQSAPHRARDHRTDLRPLLTPPRISAGTGLGLSDRLRRQRQSRPAALSSMSIRRRKGTTSLFSRLHSEAARCGAAIRPRPPLPPSPDAILASDEMVRSTRRPDRPGNHPAVEERGGLRASLTARGAQGRAAIP